jgi:hypothetical protein
MREVLDAHATHLVLFSASGVPHMEPAHEHDRSHLAVHRIDESHRRHTGLQAVGRDEYRDWEIVVEHRKVGMTLKREQFSVTISDTMSSRSEYLRGFASRLSAVQAAQRRIDFIVDIHDRHVRRNRARAARQK